MRAIRRWGAAVLIGAMAATGVGQGAAASAQVQPGGQLPALTAALGTPHVLDGRVNSVERVGDTIFLGGSFSQARNHRDTAALRRTNLLAFDARTGQISTTFVPQPNGQVHAVLPAPDGASVYVGGKFTTIGGEARKNLARVRVSDGAVLPFDAGKVTGQVKDLRLVDDRLWLAGQFTHIAGRDQPVLGTVDAQTGAFLPYMGLRLSGTLNGGTTQVLKIDVTSSGDRLAAVGNFVTVDGQARRQLVQLDLAPDGARVDAFSTRFYASSCQRDFNTYVRDVDYSPAGDFFVVTTTGAYGGSESACDTTARFETAGGPDNSPSWVNLTGGDTTHGVEITDSAVFVGGHFRWQNNPYGRDAVGPGAVARQSIAALDPSNGLPYDWNPTRTRGVGVFDFLVTEQGLWLGSDTDRIGTDYGYRGRIALLGKDGLEFPAVRPATLPNDVYRVGSTSVTARSLRGNVLGAERSVSGLSASSVRGAFMINGYLYVAQSDGTFVRRTFDGTRFGPAEQVNTADRLSRITTWRDDLRYLTGMFYDNGRIYYTRSGSSQLHYRYFTAQSGVVGAKRLTASNSVSGLSFSSVRGMFYADGRLYWSDTGGTLRSIAWRDAGPAGQPVPGTAQVVSQARTGVSWSGRDLFLFQDTAGHGAAMAPEASFTTECTSLTCSFDASASVTPGGDATYAWTFGDGRTGTGQKPDHTYTANGRYTVTLTVLSSTGATATTTRQIQVTRVNQPPTAAFEAACVGLDCTFDASGSQDADGPVTYAWQFGDGATGTGVRPTRRYATEGVRTVRLTVTDSDGATATTTQEVSAVSARVAPVAAAAANANASVHRVRVPEDVQEGDLLLLHLALNSDTTVETPAGWRSLETVNGGGVAGRTWTKQASASDAGSMVAVPLGATSKGDVTVAAYRGVGGRRAVVLAHAGTLDANTSTEHTSPRVTVPRAGSWLVTYWASKSGTDVTWQLPAGQVTRADSAGVGGGRMTAVLSDTGAGLPTGAAGALRGLSSASVGRVLMFSTVVGLE